MNAPTQVSLVPMSQAQYEDLLKGGEVERLAAALTESDKLTAEQGLERARRSFESIWPGGKVDQPDQYSFRIHHEGTDVGYLQFGVKRDAREPYAYIWDIVIDPRQRGKGLGEATLRALEEKARALGLKRIALNVFGSNRTARRLYEKLGYAEAAIRMSKTL